MRSLLLLRPLDSLKARRRLPFTVVPIVLAIAAVFAAASALVVPPRPSEAQIFGCIPNVDQRRLEMGTPNAEGANQIVNLTDPSEVVGFHFTVSQPGAAYIYIGDQWFDLDLYLYSRGQCPQGSWDKLIRAWSATAERRVLQFMRPDEQIVNLPQGEYLMVAQYKAPADPSAVDPFDPARAFTARVAVSTPYCAIAPHDELVPNPAMPSVPLPKRPADALYQLGMTIDPKEEERGPFSLLTFAAFVSPPYSDLFDFSWLLDGRPVPGGNAQVFQIPRAALSQVPGAEHKVEVTARGVREYPDPELPHVPPTLTVQCSFRVAP